MSDTDSRLYQVESDIADMQRRIQNLEQQLRDLARDIAQANGRLRGHKHWEEGVILD